jgi:hypothetical protein
MLIIPSLGKNCSQFLRLEPLNPEPETDQFRCESNDYTVIKPMIPEDLAELNAG